jgi:lipoprotein NlpD
MKDIMKNISLFTCSVIASVVVLSACAQTAVSVRPVDTTSQKPPVRSSASAQKNYEPISRKEPYTVQPGDTLYGISFRAGLSYREVASWNNIPEPFTVKIGQRLLLNPSGSATSAEASVATVTIPQETKPADAKPADIKPAIVKPPVVVPTAPAQTAAPIVSVITKPIAQAPGVIAGEKPLVSVAPDIKPASIISWRWPSEGTVIARYVQGDPTQQGINIGGKSGQPVQASGDGTVVYSGAGLVGYGELIIIKHSNEWLSAYAHNRRRLVAEGSKVKAGDVIAEMGRTGTMRDMLHFEIRRNGKPVDPLLYLPKQ